MGGVLRGDLINQATFIAHVIGERLVKQLSAGFGECDDASAAVVRVGAAGDESVPLKSVEAFRHRPGGDHRERGQLSGSEFEGFAGTSKRGEHVEFTLAETISPIDGLQLFGEVVSEPVKSSDHTQRRHVDVGAFACPGLLDPGDVVEWLSHEITIASVEGIVASMEATIRWIVITALAPVAWGTTYVVTQQFLPADYPIYGAAIRALPAGLLLLAVSRKLPHGAWWWKSVVLGTLNTGAFFVLVYLAAQTLPSSVASTIMAASPIMMMLFAWTALAERPAAAPVTGAAVGIVGVYLMLVDGEATINTMGIAAAIAAMVMSSLGYVLAKKWSADVDVFSLAAWQLIAGGAVLMPFAVAIEGAPPTVDTSAVLGFAYLTIVATAFAFSAWFTGLRHLNAAAVGLIGLLNPITGVLLGITIAGDILAAHQIGGLVLVFAGIILGQLGTVRLTGLRRSAELRVAAKP